MKTNMYTVYDKKAEVYTPPFQAINDEVAQRLMMNCVNNPEHNFGLNPEDYQLLRIGKFDDQNAHIEAEYIPLCDLITLQRGAKENEE